MVESMNQQGNNVEQAGVDVLVAGSYVFNSEDCSQSDCFFKMKIAYMCHSI